MIKKQKTKTATKKISLQELKKMIRKQVIIAEQLDSNSSQIVSEKLDELDMLKQHLEAAWNELHGGVLMYENEKVITLLDELISVIQERKEELKPSGTWAASDEHPLSMFKFGSK